MAHRLEGWTAIAYAEKHGGTLKKFTDPTEQCDPKRKKWKR
jgi:hypothetical protein